MLQNCVHDIPESNLYWISRYSVSIITTYFHIFFYDCTVHFEIYVLHTTTNALFINLVNSFKFTLKYTVISLLHVSVFNDHSALHTTHMPLYDMLPHHLIYIMM